MAYLPSDCTVVSIEPHGFSCWAYTACLSTILKEGTSRKFFLKCIASNQGRRMTYGEQRAMLELCSVIPDNIPGPIGLGWLEHKPGNTRIYFYLSEFVEMKKRDPAGDKLDPDPEELCKLVVDLHRNISSPNHEDGNFGFYTPTCSGRTLKAGRALGCNAL